MVVEKCEALFNDTQLGLVGIVVHSLNEAYSVSVN
jgi:hypothetical protein